MKILDKLFKKNNMTCAEELNILDIEDNIFYSLDGYISTYIKIAPIPFEYLNKTEKKRIIDKLNTKLAGEREILKIIVMSLPISTKEINEYLNNKRNNTKNAFKRSLLNKENK